MKELQWVGSSHNDLRCFPPKARRIAGRELRRVQSGLDPHDRKALPTAGAGVWEIRVRIGQEFRVLYVAKFEEAVFVLHAFEKKTAKTSRPDIELARARYREALQRIRRLP